VSGEADALKKRLRADLAAAMREKRGVATAALRALLAAIDNAEAVPVPEGAQRYVSHAFGGGSNEVPRRNLSHTDLEAVIARELAERRDAAAELERLAQHGRAQTLRAEAEIVAGYLGAPREQ
jgi:uncharacterized protein YqeY